MVAIEWLLKTLYRGKGSQAELHPGRIFPGESARAPLYLS